MGFYKNIGAGKIFDDIVNYIKGNHSGEFSTMSPISSNDGSNPWKIEKHNNDRYILRAGTTYGLSTYIDCVDITDHISALYTAMCNGEDIVYHALNDTVDFQSKKFNIRFAFAIHHPEIDEPELIIVGSVSRKFGYEWDNLIEEDSAYSRDQMELRGRYQNRKGWR